MPDSYGAVAFDRRGNFFGRYPSSQRMSGKSADKKYGSSYRFIGFRPLDQFEGVLGDAKARDIALVWALTKLPVALVVEASRLAVALR